MKNTGKKTLMLALAAIIGLSVATPARADWYDGHRYHHGNPWRGYRWDGRLGYYVYGPPVVVAQPVYAQPVYAQPVYAAPPPVVVEQPAYVAPPVVSLGVHIR